MTHSTESARRTGAFFDAETRRRGAGLGETDDDLALLGTVTHDPAVVRQRDRLEKAHLARVLRFRPHMRVLDLGGGAGRLALWLAPRVAEVVLVDVSEALLAVARRVARSRGITNIQPVHASVVDYVPEGRFDVIIAFGVAAYLADDEVDVLVERCAASLVPGGTLVLKDPVTTDGVLRHDRRYGDDGELIYELSFRPREWYADRVGRQLRLTYQRATCAHFFPWFLGGTDDAVDAVSSPRMSALLDRFGPLLARIDPALQAAEEALRADARLSALLAPVEVVQDLYLFTTPRPASDTLPDLSVVVIAFNEEEVLEPVVDELRDALDAAGLGYELVMVNDGSTDQTASIMDRLSAVDGRLRAVHQPNKGIGGALRTGFNAARGAYITWVPADGQIGPDAVIELFERRHEAPMLTTVYRTRDDPWFRMVISQTLNTMIRVKTGQVAKSGGNYLFSREAWARHGPQDDDTMMISTAFRQSLSKAGTPPIEVEIDCRARQGGRSKVLNPRTILRTAGQALRMGR